MYFPIFLTCCHCTHLSFSALNFNTSNICVWALFVLYILLLLPLLMLILLFWIFNESKNRYCYDSTVQLCWNGVIMIINQIINSNYFLYHHIFLAFNVLLVFVMYHPGKSNQKSDSFNMKDESERSRATKNRSRQGVCVSTLSKVGLVSNKVALLKFCRMFANQLCRAMLMTDPT